MDDRPDAPGSETELPRPPGWVGRLIANGPEQARRWMQWAWIAGVAWWIWSSLLLLVWLIAGIDPPEQSIPDFPVRIIIYQGVEGFLVGMLALGVNLRWRLAAALLPTVFLIARVIALTRLEPLAFDDWRVLWLAVYLLLFLLFLRGAQGALSYHWFTHPIRPST